MTARRGEGMTVRLRPLAQPDPARVSPLPPPGEVFADWLLSVPHGADIEAAARRQIEIIDARASLHPDVRCLRMLLVAVAGDACGVDNPRPPV